MDEPTARIFVSKPQHIEAVQWTGGNWDEVRSALPGKVLLDFGVDYLLSDAANTTEEVPDGLILVAGADGAQGEVPVPVGHWLVHQPGDLSDVWPVEDSYFRARYEPAGQASTATGTRGRCPRCGSNRRDRRNYWCNTAIGADPWHAGPATEETT